MQFPIRQCSALPAVLWALGGTALFTLVFASGKLAGGDLPALQILFIRYASGFTTLLALSLLSRQSLAAQISRRPQWHLLRAVCGAGGGVCAIHAATVMPVADATAIGLTDGVLTMLLAVVFLRERAGLWHWGAALLCLAGAVIVIKGASPNGILPLVNAVGAGAVFALLGALLIAVESILIKTLSMRESAQAVLLHVNFFGLLLLALPAVLLWTPLATWQLVFCLGLGPLAITAQYCWIRAFRGADAVLVSPIGYAWIVFAALLGLLLFDETPGLATLIGSLLICVGGVLLTRLPAAQKKSRQGCMAAS